MGSLAYRSSKLGFKSSKLAYNNPWVKMTKSLAQYKVGQYDTMDPYWDFNQYYPYMYDNNYGVDVVDGALNLFNNAPWVAGDATARIQAAHSHGYDYNTQLRPENFFLYQEGLALYTRPTGTPTISEARLWLGNAGEIFHTIQNLGRSIFVNQYDGLFNADCSFGLDMFQYLNNTWLEIVISVSDTIYQVITLTRAQLATLNSQRGNGKTVAGLGMYSYMYAGSIYVTLPSGVIALLNGYTGVAVDMYWNWNNAILGPLCQKCLHADMCNGDYNGSHFPSWQWELTNSVCAAPWATRTALARLGDLEVR